MAPSWVIDYFCPTLGTLLASVMWISSIPAVVEARKVQNLGSLNPLPWSKCTTFLCNRRLNFF